MVEKAKACLRALIVPAYRKQYDLAALHYWYYALEVPKMCHLKGILLHFFFLRIQDRK